MSNDKDNLILNKPFEFALKIISFSEEVRQNNPFEMASQIFKSGTSIGANIREAQNAERNLISFIDLKFQQKKQTSFIIGFYFVKNQNFIQHRTKP